MKREAETQGRKTEENAVLRFDRTYDPLYDMYYDEFEDMEETDIKRP